MDFSECVTIETSARSVVSLAVGTTTDRDGLGFLPFQVTVDLL